MTAWLSEPRERGEPASLEGDGGADAVRQVPFRRRAHARARPGVAQQRDVLVREVRVVDAGRAGAEHAVVGEEPRRGAPVGGLAGVVLRRLLRQMHVQRGPPLLGPARDRRQLSGGHGPYGVDGRTDPCVITFLEK